MTPPGAPICNFFLRGQCKFGDRCRNSHPAQGSSSGFGVSSWTNPNAQSTQPNNPTRRDVVFTADSMSKDLTLGQEKPMWYLSGYGPAKGEANFLGNDKSPEECRLDVLRLGNSANFASIRESEATENNNAEAVFKNARDNIQQAFEAAVNIVPGPTFSSGGGSGFGGTNGTSAFGASGTGGSAFGQPSAFGSGSAFGGSGQASAFGQGTSSSAFGQSQPTTAAFGQSAFGGGAQTTSAFGQPATTSTFGQPAQTTSAFGQLTSSAFGPAQSITSAFGQSAGGSTPAFGQPSGGTSTFGQPSSTPSAFGQPSGSTSAFGQPSFGSTSQPQSSLIKPPTAFGAFPGSGPSASQPIAPPASGSVFGGGGLGGGFSAFASQPSNFSAAAAGNGAPSPSAFGRPSTFGAFANPPTSTTTTSAFGLPAKPQISSVFGQSSFGGSQTQTQFGASPSGGTSAFSSSAPASSTFGAPSSSTSVFGQPTTSSGPGFSAFGGGGMGGSAFGAAPTLSAFGASTQQQQPTSAFGQPVPSKSVLGAGSTSNSSFGPASVDKGKQRTRGPPDFAAAMVKAFVRLGSDPYDMKLPSDYLEILPKAAKAAFEANEFEWGKIPEWIPPLELR